MNRAAVPVGVVEFGIPSIRTTALPLLSLELQPDAELTFASGKDLQNRTKGLRLAW